MPLKILYAASRNPSSKIQLLRFMREMKKSPHTVRVAAYRQSSPPINIDWTLDCLMNIFNPSHVSLENDNLTIYYDQIKRFAPDLVITDLEYFTSYVADLLNIPVWQCGSPLINFALNHEQKYNVGLFKKYYYVFHNKPIEYQRALNMLDNSERRFVYSHFCDTESPPELDSKYEWVRPYFVRGKQSMLCQHNIIAGMIGHNYKILDFLKANNDCVSFSDFPFEEYGDVIMKSLDNQEEYGCNIRNSNLFICDGSTSFLADAFYNNTFSLIVPNYKDRESLVNSSYSESLGLSQIVYDNEFMEQEFEFSIYNNSSVKFLNERIDEL